MCRLFGMLSAKPCRPSNYLCTEKCSLLKQSNAAPSKPQADGWGIAYHDGGMRVFKSANAVFNEPETFRKIVREIDSTFVLAHLRRASNPRKLPKDRLMAIENIQPFVSQDLVFAHNGTVNRPNAVDLGDYRSQVAGDNDSEVLFWLLEKCLAEESNVKDAIISMERALDKSAAKDGKPFTAVNMIFHRDNELHAYCRYQSHPRKSLCLGDRGYYAMCFMPAMERLVVMSEPPNPDKGWRTLENGELLTARVESGKVIFEIQSLPIR